MGWPIDAKLGVNPFKFGLVGSTNLPYVALHRPPKIIFFGKVVLLEPSADPIRFNEVIAERYAPPGHHSYTLGRRARLGSERLEMVKKHA